MYVRLYIEIIKKKNRVEDHDGKKFRLNYNFGFISFASVLI